MATRAPEKNQIHQSPRSPLPLRPSLRSSHGPAAFEKSLAERSSAAQASGDEARSLYRSLYDQFNQSTDSLCRLQSRRFLQKQLQAADSLQADIPNDPDQLEAWIADSAAEVGRQYRDYLARRRAGAPREFFANESHALHFINAAAPTKLVDGAWLYGLLAHWNNPHMAPLIEIYLEELGTGVAAKNHVLLYKKLLADHGGENWGVLRDEHFVQGAIQLALGSHADEFFPEVLGFNLGYEQLPLHLLITSYELEELGIDPYYFTLHVTIDNVHSGHAQKALRGLRNFLPRLDRGGDFYRRVVRGYKLNSLGAGTTSIIANFDLQHELVTMLAHKSVAGKNMHSDRCRIGGRTVNEWLSEPRLVADFLDALVAGGWIKRGEDATGSRFWRLLVDEKSAMFGVFSRAEQRLLHDWIVGDATANSARRPWLQRETANTAETDVDLNGDRRCLREELAGLGSHEARMQRMLPLLSPANHHTPVGLMATQLFSLHFGCH